MWGIALGAVVLHDEVSGLIDFNTPGGPSVDALQTMSCWSPTWLTQRPWFATPPAVEAGVRAVFAFPVRQGAARLGAVNLYRDRPGPLSDDQHADALVMADVVARWVLDRQADAPPGTLAAELELSADFHFVVHNAAGKVSVQAGISVTEALVRLRAFAFSHDRPAMSPRTSSPARSGSE
jgi:hypothetical protein